MNLLGKQRLPKKTGIYDNCHIVLSFQVPELSDSDKLYLLLLKWELNHLFNPLCYTLNVWSIADLERLWKRGWNRDQEPGVPLVSLGANDKCKLEKLIKEGSTTDFDRLYFQQVC